ncbi:MAG: FHA domain-containing protein [Candidatus Obscuribacterales bacterium]|nr:FHA domain-containing protein [Candidatus Obscuribacterales bacterium]
MKEAEESECPCCGAAIGDAGYCTACFKKPESDDKLDKVLAEIVLEKTQERFAVDVRWVRIGRDPSNQIVLNDDRYSSRYHAWVTYESDSFWLEDLGSTNGTMLNGQLVDKRELLHSGDQVKIGETEMTFRLLS